MMRPDARDMNESADGRQRFPINGFILAERMMTLQAVRNLAGGSHLVRNEQCVSGICGEGCRS